MNTKGFFQTTLYFQLWKEKKRVSLDLFFYLLGIFTFTLYEYYRIFDKLHYIITWCCLNNLQNIVWFFLKCFHFHCILASRVLIWILCTPSTSVIIHTCIHVHQIKLVYIHCSTLCNLVLWWKKNVLTCSQAENLILCLCPLQLKWSERQENMRVSLNLFSSIFFTIYFVLVYKSKKSILLDNVSRAELLQACVWYAKVWVAKLFAPTHTCANTFLDISSYRQLGKFSWMTHYF